MAIVPGTDIVLQLKMTIPTELTNLPQDMARRNGTLLPNAPKTTTQLTPVNMSLSSSRSGSLPVTLLSGSTKTHPHGYGGTIGMVDFIFVAKYAEMVAAPSVDPPEDKPSGDTPTPTPTPEPPPTPKTGDAAIPYAVAAVACTVSATALFVFAFVPRRKEETVGA